MNRIYQGKVTRAESIAQEGTAAVANEFDPVSIFGVGPYLSEGHGKMRQMQ